MIVPRRLHKTALYPPYEIVEEEDPRQAWILCGAGTEYSELEAEQLGITAYLDAYDKAHTPVEEKAITQGEVEDKSVAATEVEDKSVAAPDASKDDEPKGDESADASPRGVIIPPESRRLRGR